MLTLWGPRGRFCDGVNRRSFLGIGALACGGLSLPSLLRADQQTGRASNKSVIMVYLSGGLSHIDSFDMKPDAPREIRGEFGTIPTRLPGVRVCEYLPRLAGLMDRIALVRSIVGLRDEHSSYQTLTGTTMDQARRTHVPNVGSVISRFLGPIDPVVPAFTDLFPTMQHRPYNSPGPGFIGPAHAGARLDPEAVSVMRLRDLTAEQLQDRRRLRSEFDAQRRSLESPAFDRMETSYRQAFEVLTSSRLVDALDLTREPQHIRDRYRTGSPQHQGDGAPLWNEQLLTARRLIEAGVRCVTVAYGFWDTHGNNFSHLRSNLPVFDAGIAALVADLTERGLDQDVTLLVWGEFGRTPRINNQAGRDHWAPVNGALLAGGGMNVGQVVGATDRTGGQAAQRPIPYRDILATVYHNLGIAPDDTIPDLLNRPVHVLPDAAPVRELCG